MNEPIDVRHEVLASDGLLRRVRLSLAAEPPRLASIQSVEYDLGPTFTNRYRSPPASGGDFGLEIEAYGDFTALVALSFREEVPVPEREAGQPAAGEVLVHRVALPGPGGAAPQAPRRHGVAGASRFAIPLLSVPSWAGIALEFFVGAMLLLFAWLVLVAWPDGTGEIRLLGGPAHWRTPLEGELQLVLLAAASGAFGAVLQSAVALVGNLSSQSLTGAWLRWYLARPVVGMLFGTVAYQAVRALLFAPGAEAGDVAAWGVAALAGTAGYGSGRAMRWLSQRLEAMFAPLRREPATYLREHTMNGEHTIAAVAPSPDPVPSPDERRQRDVAQAESVLRGEDMSPEETYRLAERLKDCNEFGFARRLFARLRASNEYQVVPASPVRLGQRQALCTYKDPDLPAVDRFERAIEILDGVDQLRKTQGRETEEQQESLGLRGAIFKRWWQFGGQRADLERALGCYMQGYDLGPESDFGYTAINAAFVLELLAREDARQATSEAQAQHVERQRSQARSIRRILIDCLPGLVEKDDWLKTEWWFHATIAEAHFGLEQFDRAVQALRRFNVEIGLEHDGPPPGERVAPWILESTITQLSALADLQADLTVLARQSESASAGRAAGDEIRDRARGALREYLGSLAPGVDRSFTGKVGLALSGGGFRASLFHIGVLAQLAERDVLRRVEVLSCVSGGSIVGAHYYLEVKRLLEEKEERDITQEDYLELVARLERDFLAGVETNIRSRVYSSVWANLRAFFQPGYTTTRRLGSLYEAELFSRVRDGQGQAPRYLNELFVHPAGEGPSFKLKYDNWRRSAKVPVLILNATALNTGHNWQFTASWMGEPPGGFGAEIDGNYRLRRMYHAEAPRLRDKWRRWPLSLFAPPDYRRLRLGDAVAASSSVPGLFEPLVLPELFDGKTVLLVDGGVYDNQGVASLMEQDCTFMLVSDASGQMEALDQPSGGRLGVPLRAFSVSMARVRQSQYQDLAGRLRSGLLKGLVFLHLKKGLDADPVDWRECQDPHDASDQARPAQRRGVLTRYGIQKSIQRLLAGMRTDLDSFTEVEAFSLMTSGYRMAEADLERLGNFGTPRQPDTPWRFLQVEPALMPGPGYEEVTRQLEVAGMAAGKVWRLWRPLTVVAVALGLAAAAAVAVWWTRADDRTLVTLYGLRTLVLTALAMMVVPTVVRVVRYRQTLSDLGLRALGAALLAFLFKVHLLLFDPLFIRLGRVGRLLEMRRER